MNKIEFWPRETRLLVILKKLSVKQKKPAENLPAQLRDNTGQLIVVIVGVHVIEPGLPGHGFGKVTKVLLGLTVTGVMTEVPIWKRVMVITHLPLAQLHGGTVI
jgi:hypothetical protein